MIATLRPVWLLHIALAFAAMVGALRAGGPLGDRMAPSGLSASAVGVKTWGAAQTRAANHDAPLDRASTRLASTTRAAWQRGSRRTQRTSSSQLAGTERAPGTIVGTSPSRRTGPPSTSQFDRVRRDGRLRAAPTRAPPTDC